MYQVPKKDIYYVFQGDWDTGKMKENFECISVYAMKLKNLLSGYDRTLMVGKFVKSLYSKDEAATHERNWADPVFAHNEIAGEDILKGEEIFAGSM